MGVIRRLLGLGEKVAPRADAQTFALSDPQLADMLFLGMESKSGERVSVQTAMRNPALFRSFSLISNSIGMLPLHLLNAETKEKATDHPLFKLLHRRPNGWQSAYDFRSLLQLHALADGNGYALVIRSRKLGTGRDVVSQIVPLDYERVTPTISADWTVTYRYQPKEGGTKIFSSRDIFHLRGLSMDGLCGLSMVRQARDAIGLALAAERAAGRLFRNGSFVGGVLVTKGKLSDEAFKRLQTSWNENYSGADNAGKTPLLEEDTDYKTLGSTARDSQLSEIRKMQIEEVARVTGVPRPLLMVDETSWGSGIEALGQFFVAYALNPWFEAWQQAVERTLLDDDEQGRFAAKFNPAALLRGSLKDQADYLAKALGSGGHQPWMYAEEARDAVDLPRREAPPNPMMGHNGGPALP